ncbi:MAG: Hpt domain-containing protein [Betaproteobacteria bacterium]|nr:Hpt domain-containing protein [Betaproteobacteria bacterium]
MTSRKADQTPLDISDDMRELAALFLETRRADLARLEGALAAGDFETIRAVGHVFRGSSAAFGFPEAGQIGAQLEEAAARADRGAVEALAPLLRASIVIRGSESA